MSGFTKGPWLRSGTTVYALNARDFNRFCAHVQDAHTPDDELVAVATLMQVAPDLLEALIEVTASLEWNAHGRCRGINDGPIMPSAMAVECARAAIARARGIEE